MNKARTFIVVLVALSGLLSACGGSSASGGPGGGAVSSDSTNCFITTSVTLSTDRELVQDDATGAFGDTPQPARLPHVTDAAIKDIRKAVDDQCITSTSAARRLNDIASDVDGYCQSCYDRLTQEADTIK